MALFTFLLNSFQIADTRSAHQDTDYVLFTLKIGNGAPQQQVMPAGNVNNGVHTVNLSFSGMTVNPTDVVVLNYLIVNASGVKPADIETNLKRVGALLANGFGPTLPQLGSGVIADQTWFTNELQSSFSSPCDGLVAAEQDIFSYNDLLAKASAGFNHSTYHLGSSSRSGCNGRPSGYIVMWGMSEIARVPDVAGDNLSQAEAALTNAGLRYGQSSGTGSHVLKSNPAAGMFEPVGTPVNLVFGLDNR